MQRDLPAGGRVEPPRRPRHRLPPPSRALWRARKLQLLRRPRAVPPGVRRNCARTGMAPAAHPGARWRAGLLRVRVPVPERVLRLSGGPRPGLGSLLGRVRPGARVHPPGARGGRDRVPLSRWGGGLQVPLSYGGPAAGDGRRRREPAGARSRGGGRRCLAASRRKVRAQTDWLGEGLVLARPARARKSTRSLRRGNSSERHGNGLSPRNTTREMEPPARNATLAAAAAPAAPKRGISTRSSPMPTTSDTNGPIEERPGAEDAISALEKI